jgi:hypothetical protein
MKTVLCVIACVTALTALTRTPLAQESTSLDQSTIVLTGTVTQLGATSFAEVPKSDRTMVVQVDQVIKKPPAVTLKRGDNVTIEAKDSTEFHQGMHVTFYTTGWLFGSGVALKEIAHSTEIPSREELEQRIQPLREDLEQAVQVTDQGLENLIRRADAVVVGIVVDVHPWTPLRSTGGRTHISEHDPDWHDAVIEIQNVIKGTGTTTGSPRLVVRFPASRDIAWHKTPKFALGESGTFFLNTDQVSGQPLTMLGGRRVTAFTAMHEVDIQPAALAARVRMLENQIR